MGAEVERAPMGQLGQWARDIANTYRNLAAEEQWAPRRVALTAEAAKYDGIADRMDRLTPPADPREQGGER